jgi:hypothetical protein
MKKFDEKLAKKGNQLITRNGKDAKILLFDRDSDSFPIVAIIENSNVVNLTKDGKYYEDGKESEFDLFMKH